MSRPLLFVGEAEDVRADLAFIPGPTFIADTIPLARRALLRDPDLAGQRPLIAYGLDVAALYSAGGQHPEPLNPKAWGQTVILWRGHIGTPAPFSTEALRRLDARSVCLPHQWAWLLAELTHPAVAGGAS